MTTDDKPGVRTSEFWVAVAAIVVTVGNDVFDMGIDTETTLGMVGVVASYVLGRSWKKGKAKDITKGPDQ